MSRFVSAGTDPDSRPEAPSDDAWSKARQQVESEKKPKPRDEGVQEGSKSLYEVLQQNKGRPSTGIILVRFEATLLLDRMP